MPARRVYERNKQFPGQLGRLGKLVGNGGNGSCVIALVDFGSVDSRVLVGGGLAVVVLLWLIWAIAKKIVRLGYFLISFALGLGVALAASKAYGREQPVAMLVGEAFAFAWVWSLIRSKVARAVTAIAVVVALRFGSSFLPMLGVGEEAKAVPHVSQGKR